jgi:eukaryotic-like serine/threonine-protein kinase
MVEDYLHIKSLFGEVCDLPNQHTQSQRLRELGANPAELRQVLALLAQDAKSQHLTQPIAAALTDLTQELHPGDRLGAYTLRSELGQGGMGQVFLAERSDGHYQQRVAIKLLLGAPGAQAQALLARERQILAGLNHPHTARLLDGGTTPRGRPYLVMEFVDGIRIDQHCNQHQLDLTARLALFAQVCEAVADAHHHLVVHCDIKPSNVLVDVQGQAKLLDFGVARLQDQEADSRGLTLRYASPEQRAGQPASVSSDVYGLGRLLAELLLVLKPAPRQLEWQAIIHKASAEMPTDRYHSVAELQLEISRFSQHLPLQALPARTAYVLSKLTRRRWPWMLAGAAALTLSSGFTWRVMAERDKALVAQGLARQEVATTQQVSDLLVGLFEGADPSVSGRSDLSAAALVDRGRERIANDLNNQPDLQSHMQGVLGRVYENMGRPKPAIELYDKALASARQAPAKAHLLSRKAMALASAGMGSLALQPARAALALRQADGSDPRQTATARDTLGFVLSRVGEFDEADRQLQQALQERRNLLGPRHREVATTLHHLGMLHAAQNQWELAEARFQESLAMKRTLMADNDLSVLNTQQDLTQALANLQRLDEAEVLLRGLLDQRRKLLGPTAQPVATALNELASVLQDSGRLPQAIQLYHEVLAIEEELAGKSAQTSQTGPPTVQLAVTFNNLASAYEDAGDPAAETMYRRSVEIRQARLPEADLGLARARGNLGRWLLRQGRWAEARPLIERAWASRTAKLAPQHQERVDSELVLAELELNEGNLDGARRRLQALAPVEPELRAPRRISLLRALGLLAAASGQPTEALAQHRAAAALATSTWPPLHGAQLRIQLALVQAQWASGELPEQTAARANLTALMPRALAQHTQSPLRLAAQTLAKQMGELSR